MDRSRQQVMRRSNSFSDEVNISESEGDPDSDDEAEEVKLNYISTNLITEPNINVSNVQLEDVSLHEIQELTNELVRK